MRIGLALEGGAMRGMYTAAILDSFINENINVDCIVGVSAGALFGVNYLSGQIGRVIRYNKRYNSDKDYMGLKPLLKEGNIISTKYAYYDVPRNLDPFDDDAFKRSSVPFYVVLTNINTSKPEYVRISSVFEQMDILRASGSLPFVSKPVAINDELYLDGGITDSIPYEWLFTQSCDKIIVILTRDMDYRKSQISSVLSKICYRKYPKFVESLLNRHIMYNNAVDKLKVLEKNGDAFVIRPSEPIVIGRMEKNHDKLQSVYDLGITDAKISIPKLKKYLAQ